MAARSPPGTAPREPAQSARGDASDLVDAFARVDLAEAIEAVQTPEGEHGAREEHDARELLAQDGLRAAEQQHGEEQGHLMEGQDSGQQEEEHADLFAFAELPQLLFIVWTEAGEPMPAAAMRDLGSLAAVSQRLNRLAEAVAKIAVARHPCAKFVRTKVQGRWMLLLGELAKLRHPLTFTSSAAGIDIRDRSVAIRPRFGHGFAITGPAICNDTVMNAGVHFAEFTLVDFTPGLDAVYLGVCRADLRPNDVSRFTDFYQALFEDTAWAFACHSADCWSRWSGNNLARRHIQSDWAATTPAVPLAKGDRVGLALDFDACPTTLTAYINGTCCGPVK